MNKIYKIEKQILFALLAFSLFFCSCSDWLEQEAFSDMNTGQVPDSDEGANMWVTGVYNEMVYMFTWSNYFRVMDFDNDYASGPSWAFNETGVGNFEGSGRHVKSLWEQSYVAINRGNEAVYHISNMQNVSSQEKANALGEVYFLQAYNYFNLVRAFGAIPIHEKSVNQGGDPNQPRKSIPEVYDHIISLLQNAKSMMYKNTDAGYKEGRACAGAAATLLAKVYATAGSASMPSGEQITIRGGKPFVIRNNVKSLTALQPKTFSKAQVAGYESFDSQAYYVKARDLADSIVNLKSYGNHELIAYSDLWKKAGRTSKEHFFALQAISGDEVFGATYTGGYCGQWIGGFQTGYVLSGANMVFGLRDHWYKLFESNDLRVVDGVIHRWQREWNVEYGIGNYYPNTDEWKQKAQGYTDVEGNVISPSSPFDDGLAYNYEQTEFSMAYLSKFADVADISINRTDAPYPLLRYADAALILAEASCEVDGPSQQALDALNAVRERSNATPETLVKLNTKALFRSAVLEERAREFAGESNRRWDLIRWGIYIETMNFIGGIDENNITKTREQKHLLYPIPIEELNANDQIEENNPGWS
jgi:hypothetical protein